jgi:hypothetical protein
MRQRRSHALLVALLVSPNHAALATEPVDQPARFTLEAELRPIAVSACGRFALEATARYLPEASSADGRFALKVLNVPSGGCDPLPDPMFSNGFEFP